MCNKILHILLMITLALMLSGHRTLCAETATAELSEPITFEIISLSPTMETTTEEAKGANMTVVITNFRNNKGVARINLFTQDEGFPTEAKKARKTFMTKITDKKVKIMYTAVPSGEYAISVVHDEDPNDDVYISWLDIPATGYGSTSKSRNYFERPTFYGAKFFVGTQDTTVNIKMSY